MSKPDILFPFSPPDEPDVPVCVVYVRPETNLINYEKEIVSGIRPFGKPIYIANISGKVFIENSLIIKHYSTMYKFCRDSKEEIKKFPEMVSKFENYFNEDFEKAHIISPFKALDIFDINEEELFSIIVPDDSFLKMYGQTIKKIKDCYVVNYNIPALISKYSPESNVFVIAFKLNDKEVSFKDVNHSIFNHLAGDKTTPFVDADKLHKLEWSEKVTRTYHISHNTLTAIFDMLDFIYKKDGTPLDITDIPSAHYLISNEIVSQEKFKSVKHFSLCYREENNDRELIDVSERNLFNSFNECVNELPKISVIT